MLPGPYRVPAYRATGHLRLTNKTPGGTYRAPGRYESTFVRERLLDAIAAQIGISIGRGAPAQSHSAGPRCPTRDRSTRSARDVVLDSGDYAGLLDKALAAIDWDSLQADAAQAARAGEKPSASALRCSSRRAGSVPSTA